MHTNNMEKISKENEITFRKCNAVYTFWWLIFFITLLLMFICLFTLNLWHEWQLSILEFFCLLELIIIIAIIEAYVNILIVWKNGIRIENWILVRNKKEIPYDKINTINTHSAFWLWTLEILTGNDSVTRYKFLDKYEEAENLIKERMNHK